MRGIDMYEVFGADWCGTCQAVRKKLTALDIPFNYIPMPAGATGWKTAEKLCGKRALPVIRKDGQCMDFFAFKAELESAGQPRPLTQDELDELE